MRSSRMNQTPAQMIVALALVATPGFAAQEASVEGKNIRVEFDGSMHSRLVAAIGGRKRAIGDFAPSEFIRVSGKGIEDFALQKQTREPIRDRLGAGFRTILTGAASPLKKTVIVTMYDQFPRMAFFDVEYTNTGASDLPVNGWTNQHYFISASAAAAQPAFWS